MHDFKPKRVYYEEAALDYELGKELYEKYNNQGIPMFKIESHNNIEELRQRPDKDFPEMKRYIIIGVRKSLTHKKNSKISDFLVPYTSSGCTAMCLYCYLVCTYYKGSYLRLFVNREAMMRKILRADAKSEKPIVFEIGSNSDLILENTITGNLRWTIEQFAKEGKGLLTLPTKFDMVDDILDLDHNEKILVRMSINPQEIISEIEPGTSRLKNRIIAINKLHKAGYKVGILVAPLILVDGWLEKYKNMMDQLRDEIDLGVTKGLKFELIYMTYGYAHKQINPEAFPNKVDLYDKDIMSPCGRGRYSYKVPLKEETKPIFNDMIMSRFPESEIAYIV